MLELVYAFDPDKAMNVESPLYKWIFSFIHFSALLQSMMEDG